MNYIGKNYKKRVLFVCICCILTVFGCSKKQNTAKETELLTSDVPTAKKVWDRTVLVFFGEGFNTPQFMNEATRLLSQQFGLESEQGFVRTVIYPDAFLIGKTPRISRLSDMIQDEMVQAVVLLGAPEGTEFGLAKIRDSGWSYPMVSLFPQGDTIAQSSDCDVVIEARITQETASGGETELSTEGVSDVLCSIVSLLAENRALASGGEALKNQLETQLGDSKKLHYYVDVQTGLRSVNCFVIE